MNSTELIGYLASFLIMLSFMAKEIRRLRMINCVGCLTFVVYGVLLDISWPVVITNTFIFCLNLWHLTRPKTS
jgi:uncharacterized protein with PQ loop repeat